MSRNVSTTVKSESTSETIRRLMEAHYDLGVLTNVKKIAGGYCNLSYVVWMTSTTGTLPFFLRLYNPVVSEKEIQFEHALLKHLRSKDFTLVAAIIPCRSGQTIVRTPAPENHSGKEAFWALFEFLEGEDRYTWTDTDLTEKEFASAGAALARLHHAGNGFRKPPEAERVQPRIMDFLPTLKPAFSSFISQTRGRRCDDLFNRHFKSIFEALEEAIGYKESFLGMPQIPIHCDYHPGNLKYRNETCVGIFDFDWSKIDYRLFDLALGLVYFTSNWNDRSAGLRPEPFKIFLKAYEDTSHVLTDIGPLNQKEMGSLVPMLSIANLYVLNWDLVDFYNLPEPDDDEYYTYVSHNIDLMHWITRNAEKIIRMTEKTS